MLTSENHGGQMAYHDDVRLLIEISHMYYGNRLTQNQIAEKLSISRSLVSKCLTKAHELGIVEITIRDEHLHPYKEIEDKIKEHFELEEMICVNASETDSIKQRISDAAAKYLSRIIKQDTIIGVSAGTTVHEVASNLLLSIQMSNLTFVPLVGGLGKEHNDIQSNVICDIFARRTGGICVDVYAPVLVDSEEAKRVLLSQKFIKSSFDLMKQVDVALVGIGGKPTYYEMSNAYLHKVDPMTNIGADGVVGDICYNFIDKNGTSVDSEWNHRVMAISLDELKKLPLVVGVAGGDHKIEGIKAALVGKLVNVLITDIYTARKLLLEIEQ